MTNNFQGFIHTKRSSLPVPPLRLIKPLMSVDGNLCSERFGQNQDIANDGRVRAENNNHKILMRSVKRGSTMYEICTLLIY
jgi:hypothetical protein